MMEKNDSDSIAMLLQYLPQSVSLLACDYPSRRTLLIERVSGIETDESAKPVLENTHTP